MNDRAQFERAAIDEAKERFNISDLASRWCAKPLKRAGHEMAGLCLFHHERTPSMRVNDLQGTYHCFGCGIGGDIIDLVMRHEKLDFIEAMRWLGAAELPAVDHSARRELAVIEKAERRANCADARRFFAEAVPIAGTPAEVYLRARGLDFPEWPAALRYGVIPPRRDLDTREWVEGRPCLVCAVQDKLGDLVGIQRVYFKRDDPKLGKADCKLSLGVIKGAAIRFGPALPEVALTEGPEDGLSVLLDQPHRSVWVALGTGLLPFMDFPSIVESILICGQNNAAGEAAVVKAADAFCERGLGVARVFPPTEYDDWNDFLRGVMK